MKRLFREDPRALAELRRLERGELTEEDFSERFAPMLGVSDTEALVDRLFAGMGPDEPMIEAVKKAKRSGVKTGLISNSWGRGRYDREAFPEMFDGVVISGEVGLHKPEPEIFHLGAKQIGPRARGVRLRRRPQGELRRRRGGRDDPDPPPRRRHDAAGARAPARARAPLARDERRPWARRCDSRITGMANDPPARI